MENQNTSLPNIPVVNPPVPKRHTPGKWLVAAMVLVMVGVASVLVINNKPKQSVKAEPTGTVQITSSGFVPQTIRIKAGESVTWVNTDTAVHEVAANPSLKGFDTPEALKQNGSVTFTFDEVGSYGYHDPLNPDKLKATVIVE